MLLFALFEYSKILILDFSVLRRERVVLLLFDVVTVTWRSTVQFSIDHFCFCFS